MLLRPPKDNAIRTRGNRRAVVEAVLVAGVLAALGILALDIVWERSRTALHAQLRTSMTEIALSAATTIDPELHARITRAEQIDTPEYEAAVAPLRRIDRSLSEIKYAYTAVLADDGDVHFVLDAAAPGDADGDGVEDRAGVWEVYEDADPQMFVAFGSEGTPPQATSTPVPYQDRWGVFMTGYAPFFHSDGRFAGVVGVDMDASRFMARMATARREIALGALPMGLIVLATAMLVYLLRQREHESGAKLRDAFRKIERLAAAIGVVRDALAVRGARGKGEYSNPRFEEFFGVSSSGRDDGNGDSHRSDARSRFDAHVDRCIERGEPWNGRLATEGGARWLEISVTPLVDSDEGTSVAVVSARDVTEQVAAEAGRALEFAASETKATVARELAREAALGARFESALAALVESFRAGPNTAAAAMLLGEKGDSELEIAATSAGFDVSASRDALAAAQLSLRDARGPTAVDGGFVVPIVASDSPIGVLYFANAPLPPLGDPRRGALPAVTELFATVVLRERAMALLLEAGARARAASRTKAEFLANMSHEIRTPLTAILGYADVLRTELSSAALTRESMFALNTIESAGQHLGMLIDDILDLSKIEAGRVELERVETSVADIANEVVGMMAMRAEAKGIGIRARLASALPSKVLGDPTRIRQVLVNLVGNAVKFTEHGQVELVVGAEDDRGGGERLVMDVIDDGPGIPPDRAARLFEPFSQADASVTRRHGGTGLGLSICRRLCDLMGGGVRILWSEPGRGTCFRVELPLVRVAGTKLVENLAATRCRPAPRLFEKKLAGHVLLVEDVVVNRALVTGILTRAGARVTAAVDGVDALSKVDELARSRQAFDLIVTDVQMPRMDGFALARELHRRGSSAPIIALTAHAMAEDRARCLEAGCSDHAVKPIDRVAFLETCFRWLTGGTARRSA
jgi:PAS domain S-box-containing protein